MFFVSEEYLRKYKETGDVGGSTLGEVAPLGETLFPEETGGGARGEVEAGAEKGVADRSKQKGRPAGRPLSCAMSWLVCGGEDLGLHQVHGLATALNAAVAGLDAEHFRVADLADESLA